MLWVEVAAMSVADMAGTLSVWDEEELPPPWAEELMRQMQDVLSRLNPKPEPKYMSVEEVAQRWGLSTKSVRRFVASGELCSSMIGHCRRILRTDVEAFEEARAARYLRRKGAAA